MQEAESVQRIRLTMTQEDSLREKIAELLNKMTLEEKVSLLAGVDKWHTRGI